VVRMIVCSVGAVAWCVGRIGWVFEVSVLA